LQPQPDGFLLLSPKGIEEDFAQDLTAAEKAQLVAAQTEDGRIDLRSETGRCRVARQTELVRRLEQRPHDDPEQEKSMAKQIKAKTTVLPSSHVAMLSHPAEVAKVIEEASANGHRQ